jgi:hypothetical protein
MILVNSQLATLTRYNRVNKNEYFDDVADDTITIKVVPYDVDDTIRFGIYSVPEATGYFIVGRNVDIREGDQIQFIGKFLNKDNELSKRKLTVLKVQDGWLFNRVENQIIAVK